MQDSCILSRKATLDHWLNQTAALEGLHELAHNDENLITV